MSKRFMMVMLGLLAIGTQAFAQSKVTGTVTDETGAPAVGVNVLVKGTSTGTMTDLDGAYALNAKASDVLVFSMISYKTVEVTVGKQSKINVVLEPDSMYLDDVVVVGYGTARKKDVSGAISSVNFSSDKNIATLPNPNALSALSSRVAGFSYAPTSSAGGDNTSTMTIRGMNAIPSGGSKSASAQSLNRPLLVVDGVISYDSINSINTNDIQSIDVLKDASAAAIYGSRAANGVIIITTKQGSSDKPTVSFNAQLSLSDWSRTPKFVSDETTFFRNRFYSKAASDASLLTKDWATYDKSSLFVSDVEQAAYNNGVRTDWIDEISRTGVGQKYDVSVSGRTKTSSYYVSGNYTRQQGIRIGDDYEKFTFMAKYDANVTSWLKVGGKANFLSGDSWGQAARIQNATWMSPYSYVMVQTPGYENWYNSKPDGSTISPLWGTGAGDSYLWTSRSSKSTNIQGMTYAQIDFPFLKGLSYRVTAQGQRNYSTSDVFSRPEIWVDTKNTAQMDDPLTVGGTQAGGSSSASNSFYWNIDNILTYNADFGKNHVDAMLGYTREHYVNNSLGISFTGYSSQTDFLWYDAESAANKDLSRDATETSKVSYLARVNYNYASKYYLTANFRRDGYSVFAPGHKWGNFYGLSGAWVLSNEDFVKSNLSWVDFLKLRLSYGQNGSQTIGAYATTSSVVNTQSNSGTRTDAWLGGAQAYGVKINQLPNQSLTWATVSKADLGVDFTVLGGRLSGSIDGYLGETTNMLVARSAPYITGFSSVNANAGRVTNNGIEIVLNSVNINGNGQDKLRWESSIVFDHNTNKLASLYSGTSKDVASYLVTPEGAYALIEGESINAAYDLKMLGIFQTQAEIDAYTFTKDGVETKIMPDAQPGDVKFADINNDGKINDDDRIVLGTTDPLFTMNIGNTLTWKGFSLYFNFRWGQGNDTHFLGLDPNAFGTSMGSGNQLERVKPWVDTDYYKNLTNEFPRYGYNNDVYKYQWWNSRSFLKLKDLSFSYTIPQNVIKNMGLSNARVYVAGTDLFTITGWSGLDPETAGTIASGAASSRYGSNGTYKTVTFGVNLTF